MILQALADYYRRKQEATPGALAPEGFEYKEIPFVLVLSRDGALLEIEDTRSGEGKARRAKAFTVPKMVKRANGITSNLLWDNAEYALGLVCDGRDTKPERLQEQHAAFKARLQQELSSCSDEGLSAVRSYLDGLSPESLNENPSMIEVRSLNPNISFRLTGDPCLVAERPNVVSTLQQRAPDSKKETIRCLITGEMDALARLHPAIKGVWDAQSSGANIVSFNLPAFSSFGLEQGSNAPVGEKAAEAYTKALNSLLSRDSKQRVQVGDASTVFWTERADSMVEDWLTQLAGGRDDPDADTQKVESLLKSVHNGVYVRDDGDARFYVLGLAPNAARIAIRFWHAASIREFAVQMERYFRDIEIIRPSYEGRRFLPLFSLLRSIAMQSKAENIPPRLGGDSLRAILEGRPLPASLLQAAVLRCRAEQHVTYARAAVIKACLNRVQSTIKNPSAEGRITVALDLNNKDPAYRLGRLFAALEKTQLDASPGINATIRERYYGAASSSPGSVFPLLLRLKNHHLAKLEGGMKISREKLFGEIMDGLAARKFPSHLPLAEQGLFAVGYYHQTQSFYAKKSDGITTTSPEE